MNLTKQQLEALQKVAEGRFHFVSVSTARQLEGRGLINFRPHYSETGIKRITRWTGSLTDAGRTALKGEAR